MDLPVSPLAPETIIKPAPVPGVRLATRACGVRYKDRTDVLLALFDAGTTVAGVLTRSATRSAPVEWCASGLTGGAARALVVNSGNANAFTGLRGSSSVENIATAAAAGGVGGCRPSEVFVASTGTIGEFLPDGRITDPLPAMAAEARADAWGAAARAIMTTDTFPKTASVTTRIGDVPVTLSGIAKGSGMIAPDMATMLAFVCHRRGPAGRGAGRPVAPGGRRLVQQHHGGRRHLDLRYAVAVRHRQGGQRARQRA